MAQTAVTYRPLSQAEVDVICARHDRLWRAKPGGARAVFAFADLSNLDLSGRNLQDADFSGAILAGANMSKCTLDSANLFAADLQNVNLVEASLRRSDLRGACLRGANLTGADLFEADLREGSIASLGGDRGLRIHEPLRRASDAQGTNLRGANLQRSRLSGIMAVKADFTDAVMKDCKLVRANLKQATLRGADLAGADLSGSDFTGADLQDAILVGAKTTQWTTDQANMTDVLTDAPRGAALESLPYADMLAKHALWCETGGAAGHPSKFDGADLRALKSARTLNLTALSAKGHIWRAPIYAAAICAVRIYGARA
jgi:uncharacterized protein YjbI with pentapeptide repeats